MTKKRRKLDFYPTPVEATRALFEDSDSGQILGTILEPCVGRGDMYEIIKEYRGERLIASDIDSKWSASALDATNAVFPEFDWAVTNPPFNSALNILDNLFFQAKKGVALLLRVTFNEPTKDRGPWLQSNPPSKIIHLPRISFTGDGNTDSAHAAWFIWYKNGYTPLRPHEYVTKGQMKGYRR